MEWPAKGRRAGPPENGGQAHTVEVTASTLYEAVALPRVTIEG